MYFFEKISLQKTKNLELSDYHFMSCDFQLTLHKVNFIFIVQNKNCDRRKRVTLIANVLIELKDWRKSNHTRARRATN